MNHKKLFLIKKILIRNSIKVKHKLLTLLHKDQYLNKKQMHKILIDLVDI